MIKIEEKENLEEIELCFENCEVVTLKFKKDFKFLGLQGIKENLFFSFYNNLKSNKTVCCEDFLLLITKEGLNCYTSFSTKYDENKKQECILENRLKNSNDIVSVTLKYNSEKQKEIFVDWNEEDDFQNKYQTNKLDKDGNMLIIISHDQNLKNYFYKWGK